MILATNQFLRENSKQLCESEQVDCKQTDWAPRNNSYTTTTQENYLKEKANPNYTGYIIFSGFLIGLIVIALLIYIVVVLNKKDKKPSINNKP